MSNYVNNKDSNELQKKRKKKKNPDVASCVFPGSKKQRKQRSAFSFTATKKKKEAVPIFPHHVFSLPIFFFQTYLKKVLQNESIFFAEL